MVEIGFRTNSFVVLKKNAHDTNIYADLIFVRNNAMLIGKKSFTKYRCVSSISSKFRVLWRSRFGIQVCQVGAPVAEYCRWPESRGMPIKT